MRNSHALGAIPVAHVEYSFVDPRSHETFAAYRRMIEHPRGIDGARCQQLAIGAVELDTQFCRCDTARNVEDMD